jgi:ABC-type transporter Mla subunit MlaD
MRLTSNRPGDRGLQRAAVIALGMSAVVFAVVLVVIGYKAPDGVPGRGYYTIEAEFDRADNLADHYQVRVGGELVGQVLNPRVREGRAIVDLQLKKDVEPLLSDTRLRVRPRSAIGVRFLDVTPGTRGRPVREGERIVARQTSAALPLDDALGILDARRRRKAQVLLDKLGAGSAGRGEDLNTAIGDAPGLLGGLRDALTPLNAMPGATEGFVRGLEGFVRAAEPVRRDIATGFDPEARALRPLSTHAGALRATLEQAPPTLDAARDQLPATRVLLGRTAAFARSAGPTLGAAPRALRRTSALLREARPSLRDADATLDLAGRAVGPTLRLLRTVRPVLPDVDRTLLDTIPLVRELGVHGCDVQKFGLNWAEATAFGNTGGNFLRLAIVRPSVEQLQAFKITNRSGIGSNAYPKPCETGTEAKP